MDGYDRESVRLYWIVLAVWLGLILAGVVGVVLNVVGWAHDPWWKVALGCAFLWGLATFLALTAGRGLSGEMSRIDRS